MFPSRLIFWARCTYAHTEAGSCRSRSHRAPTTDEERLLSVFFWLLSAVLLIQTMSRGLNRALDESVLSW